MPPGDVPFETSDPAAAVNASHHPSLPSSYPPILSSSYPGGGWARQICGHYSRTGSGTRQPFGWSSPQPVNILYTDPVFVLKM